MMKSIYRSEEFKYFQDPGDPSVYAVAADREYLPELAREWNEFDPTLLRVKISEEEAAEAVAEEGIPGFFGFYVHMELTEEQAEKLEERLGKGKGFQEPGLN